MASVAVGGAGGETDDGGGDGGSTASNSSSSIKVSFCRFCTTAGTSGCVFPVCDAVVDDTKVLPRTTIVVIVTKTIRRRRKDEEAGRIMDRVVMVVIMSTETVLQKTYGKKRD